MLKATLPVLLLVFASAVAGCVAANPRRPTIDPPPSEAVRSTLGTIGIVRSRGAVEVMLQTPARGVAGGLGRGATIGLLYGAEPAVAVLGAGSAGGPAALLAVVLAAGFLALGIVIGMPVGAMVGMSLALPAQDVDRAEGTLRNSIAEAQIEERLPQAVLQEGRRQTSHDFVIEGACKRRIRRRGLLSRAAREGVDTILEVEIRHVGLVGPWRIDPPMDAFVWIDVRLVRSRNRSVLHSFSLHFREGGKTFTEWAEDDGEPFRKEMDRAVELLSERIVEELFLLYPMED